MTTEQTQPNFEPYVRLPITERHVRLLWEMSTMVDVDTLNDNLEAVDVDQTTNGELRELASILDPDGKFQREWSEGPHAGL